MINAAKPPYARRATEYIAALGHMEDMDPLDVKLIGNWATGLSGPLLDARCGPGHWTEFLHSKGCGVVGIDAVPEFVKSAQQRFPTTSFQLGNLLALPYPDATFSGVLAWYSLIHMPPVEREQALNEISRVLVPGGSLLLGGFWGLHNTLFEHAITPGYFWGLPNLIRELKLGDWHVMSTDTRHSKERRPHLTVTARRRSG